MPGPGEYAFPATPTSMGRNRLAETMVKHGKLAFSGDEMQQIILNDEDKGLY